jgi:hypothetical protein
MKARPFLLFAWCAVGACLAGCTTVKPWQRGALSDYTMRSDRDPIGKSQDDHIFFSREMSSGGEGVGAGGCGCN